MEVETPGPTPLQSPEEVTTPLVRWYGKRRRLTTERIENLVRKQWNLDVQGNILICSIKISTFPNAEEEESVNIRTKQHLECSKILGRVRSP